MKTWYAPAKLNLFLHVVGRYADGYHEIQTIFQLIDWFDELQFSRTRNGKIRRISEIEGIPESIDLTVRAATLLRSKYPGREGVDIHLKKTIPVGAGFGGGSADAAITLLALNELWDLHLSQIELMKIGAELGADVPVFVRGTNAWAEGRGEILSTISLPEQLYLVTVPPVVVFTKQVYESCKFRSFRPKIAKSDFAKEMTANDLSPVVCRLYPEVLAAFKWHSQIGEARVTGSGCAVFSKLKNKRQGELLLAQMPSAFRGRICLGRAS